MAAPYVEQGRQLEVRGQLQLRFEQLLLALAIQLLEKIIQADLTHRTQLRMARQAVQPVAQLNQVGRAVLVEIDRVQAEGGVQVGIALHQLPEPLPIALINPQHHHPPHAEGAAGSQQRLTIRVEIRKIQMGVAVDQFHVQAS